MKHIWPTSIAENWNNYEQRRADYAKPASKVADVYLKKALFATSAFLTIYSQYKGIKIFAVCSILSASPHNYSTYLA